MCAEVNYAVQTSPSDKEKRKKRLVILGPMTSSGEKRELGVKRLGEIDKRSQGEMHSYEQSDQDSINTHQIIHMSVYLSIYLYLLDFYSHVVIYIYI